MHANKREDVSEIRAGDIGAVIGLKQTVTGDTLCDEAHQIVLESITFPAPVMAVAIEPRPKPMLTSSPCLCTKCRGRPHVWVHTDEDTGQTIIAGMEELHLEILVDRLAREFHVGAVVSRPQVAYKRSFVARPRARAILSVKVAAGDNMACELRLARCREAMDSPLKMLSWVG